MFGMRFIKAQPTTYLIQYRKGAVAREGAGLAFFYFSPTTSLVAVPIESVDAPFMFGEVTADFQDVTVQGHVTYRVAEPGKLSQLMNFTLDRNGRDYVSEDPQKLPERVLNCIQVAVRAELLKLTLRRALVSSDVIGRILVETARQSPELNTLGIEILGLAILAIKPAPETARALAAEIREQLLKEADSAIYARRNAAVEQERAIKENELQTEIATEMKKQEIQDAKLAAERAALQKRMQMNEERMAGDVSLEEQRKALVLLEAENARQEADARAYLVAATVKPLAGLHPEILLALASSGMDSSQLIAMAFRNLAENASKIGELNVSPELLNTLLKGRAANATQ